MTVDMNHLPPCGCVHECQSVSFTICRDGRGRMTPRQIELARHALGLNRVMVSCRNAFVAGPGHVDFAEWERMVAAGHATKGPAERVLGGDHVFRLTRAGAEAALQPGERLDPEDWPETSTQPAAGIR